MNDNINPYFVIGKLMEQPVDKSKIDEFINAYLKISINEGKEAKQVLLEIKNFSMQMNNSIMDSCVNV